MRVLSLLALTFVTTIATARCFTYANSLAIRPGNRHVRLNDSVSFRGAEISDTGWVRLLFDGLSARGTYEQCIAPGSNHLDYCPPDFQATRQIEGAMDDGLRAIFFQKYGVALFNPRLKQSIHIRHHLQFDAPTAAWISPDGNQIQIEYWNARMHKNTCYLEGIDYKTSKTRFIQDCIPGRPPAGFLRMERKSLDNLLLVELFPPSILAQKNTHQYFWIHRPGPMQHVIVRDVWGQERESGYPILYALYPITVALDIVTFPLQYFFWKPPCPLG